MRLINATTLELEEFFGTVPNYAILSHTWSVGDEVSFEEFQQNPRGTKRGYAKIHDTCRQALIDGHGYCWIDTCCIAKTSSAELTEAINSMFNWYKDAEVCYVHLDDYKYSDDLDPASTPQFAKCRWFTRGWCLQELIAPAQLAFYDRNWRYIGSKTTLRSGIARITGVDEEILEDSSRLSACAVAKRMSWASKRQTTRVEDMAYCLLGIFDVNMPMLYGEGEKAFTRLQEEIVKKSNDLSIFAWSANDSWGEAYVDMFAPSPAFFRKCHNIVRSDPDHRSLANHFSITNRGILFTAAELYAVTVTQLLEDEGPGYVLRLDCREDERETAAKFWKYLYLKKIGPALYVRHGSRQSHKTVRQPVKLWMLERDFYVVQRITPDIRSIIDQSHRGSFEIMFDAPGVNVRCIRGLKPQEAWDSPRGVFLQGGPSSTAYIKICPDPTTGHQGEYFILTVGYHRGADGYADPLAPFASLVCSDVWEMFEGEGKMLEWVVESAISEQNLMGSPESDCRELILSRHKVTVSLHTKLLRGLPYHAVSVDWNLPAPNLTIRTHRGNDEDGC